MPLAPGRTKWRPADETPVPPCDIQPDETDIAISNHPKSNYTHLQLGGIPYYYLPVEATSKQQQEAALWRLIEATGAELVILARYMQILSDELAGKLKGRCINIHHSFLPGFKGAKPYHQAHARGVKLIGATAHYVTAELDEGPISEQDVERITHSDTAVPFRLIAVLRWDR